MGLSVVDQDGVRIVEGTPDQPFLSHGSDAVWLVEACFSNRARCLLLYARNLPDRFFDLSSGEAGEILQKLRNYGVRLAIVCPEGSATFSSRFPELLEEERSRPHFGVFDARDAARAWLRAGA